MGTAIKPADAVAQEVATANKGDIEGKTGKTYGTFDVVSYGTQLVAGTNYFLKINTGDEHIHARVYKDLGGDYSVHSVQEGKSADDELAYF